MEAGLKRVPVSQAIADLKEFISKEAPNDPLVNPEILAKKGNPWKKGNNCKLI